MIKRVWAKNYRSLAHIDVELESGITVLVGLNGSGKSNFVDLFRFIKDCCQLGLDSAVVQRHGMGALRRWSSKGRPFDVEVGLTCSAGECVYTYTFTLGSQRRGEYRIKAEACSIIPKKGETTAYATRDGAWTALPPGIAPPIGDRNLVLPLLSSSEPYASLYSMLNSITFYNIMPSSLAEPQKPANPYPLLEDGSNLASTLREMRRTKHQHLAHLNEAVSTVLTDIKDLVPKQVGGYLVTQVRHQMTEGNNAFFELSQESDGTLRVLGILMALYQGYKSSLLALEEPELTIHPGALPLLWEQIDLASDLRQILVTTHSPDLLDLCTAQQLRIVEKVEGCTRIGLVADDQRQAIQKGLFAPGEMLRAEGLRLAQGELDL